VLLIINMGICCKFSFKMVAVGYGFSLPTKTDRLKIERF
jgi:hypothetical protein